MTENDKTIRHNDAKNNKPKAVSDETVIKNGKEQISSEVKENNNIDDIKTFKEFKIIKENEARGGEADTFIIENSSEKSFLKLYRKGIEPKQEVVKKISELSNNYNDYFIRIKQFGKDDKTNRYYEIMEYATGGNLKEYLEKNNITVKDKIALIQKINEGLNILHKNDILYLDLKPSNILLKGKNIQNIVLSDFGISNVLEAEQTMRFTQVRGTPQYMAPEMFSRAMRKESDYWALGMCIYELCYGKLPFAGLNEAVIALYITTKNIEFPEGPDVRFIHLMKGLLLRNYDNRYGFRQIENWVKGKNLPKVIMEEAIESKRSFELIGERYQTLKDLSSGFIKSEINWREAKKSLGRGEFSSVCEQNGDKKDQMFLDNLKNSSIDENLKLLRITYTYNKDLPLVIFGKKISVSNLYLYLGKYLNDKSTEGEKEIIEIMIKTSNLINYINEYFDLTKSNNIEYRVIVNIVKFINSIGLSEEDKIDYLKTLLDRYNNKQKLNGKDNKIMFSILEKEKFDPKSVKILKNYLGIKEPEIKLTNNVNWTSKTNPISNPIPKTSQSSSVNFKKIVKYVSTAIYSIALFYTIFFLFDKTFKNEKFRTNFWGSTTFVGIYDRIGFANLKEKELKMLSSIDETNVEYGYYFTIGRKNDAIKMLGRMIQNNNAGIFDKINYSILSFSGFKNMFLLVRLELFLVFIILIISSVIIKFIRSITILPKPLKWISNFLVWTYLAACIIFLIFTNGTPMLPESFIKIALFGIAIVTIPATYGT